MCGAARSAARRQLPNPSHVHTNAGGSDHDVGRDTRRLRKSWLGDARPASSRFTFLGVRTVGATGCDERDLRLGVEHRRGAIRPAGRVHAAPTGIQFEHGDWHLRRARVGRRDRVSGVSAAATDASGNRASTPAERLDACALALSPIALDPHLSDRRPLAGGWPNLHRDTDRCRRVLRVSPTDEQERVASDTGARCHQYIVRVVRDVYHYGITASPGISGR